MLSYSPSVVCYFHFDTIFIIFFKKCKTNSRLSRKKLGRVGLPKTYTVQHIFFSLNKNHSYRGCGVRPVPVHIAPGLDVLPLRLHAVRLFLLLLHLSHHMERMRLRSGKAIVSDSSAASWTLSSLLHIKAKIAMNCLIFVNMSSLVDAHHRVGYACTGNQL